MAKTIDINSDLGEGIGNDEDIMPFISSANIACGAHAGSPAMMERTVRLAKQYEVQIGAHPGYADAENFGRIEMHLSAEEIEDLVLQQISALAEIARANGCAMAHVKAHGALYNQAAKERPLADAIVRAVKCFDKELILYGLAGSQLIAAGIEGGLRVAAEGFPDRAYEENGGLRSRKMPGALIEDPKEAAANGLRLAGKGVVITRENGEEKLRVDTLCVHGDSPWAVETAKALNEILEKNHFKIAALKKY
jgi:UPF0271 protein